MFRISNENLTKVLSEMQSLVDSDKADFQFIENSGPCWAGIMGSGAVRASLDRLLIFSERKVGRLIKSSPVLDIYNGEEINIVEFSTEDNGEIIAIREGIFNFLKMYLSFYGQRTDKNELILAKQKNIFLYQ